MINNPGMEDGTQEPWLAPMDDTAFFEVKLPEVQDGPPGMTVWLDAPNVSTTMGRTRLGRWLLRRLLKPITLTLSYKVPGDDSWHQWANTIEWRR